MRPADLGSAEIDAWHAMQNQGDSLANPFLSPEFTVVIGRSQPAARVAVLTESSGPVGFFPFERGRLGAATPIGAGLSDCQGLVHVPGFDWEPAGLLRGCGISAWHFDHLVAGQQPFARFQAATAASPVMDITGGFGAYCEGSRARSPRFWRDLGRKTRKIEREAGALKLAVDAADVEDLRTLMSWKSDQYQRTGRSDRFDQPRIVEVVENLMAYRSGAFRGVLSILYAGGTPVAGHFGIAYGGVLAEWFPAYDTRFAKYSPGLIQLVRMAEEIGTLGVCSIDLGKGEMRYKEELKSYDLTVAEGTVTRPSALAAVHWAAAAPPRWAVRRIRQHPGLYSAADRVLKGVGRIRVAMRPAR
ncbi:MAG TPA: GNAT family N-acetyltransferase [Streptosporangiaceae bacterium]|nr:GNAT family N-acetyltransferase [Streptosporangiaceae bacterium]